MASIVAKKTVVNFLKKEAKRETGLQQGKLRKITIPENNNNQTRY